MGIEAPSRGGGRTRPWHYVLLFVLTAILLWMIFSGGTATPVVPTTGTSRAVGATPGDQIEAADLDVKIESLAEAPAPLGDAGRNPFRFQPKPPPPPPPMPPAPKPGPVGPVTSAPSPGPVGPPPIGTLVRFIGIVDTGTGKVGAFIDCRTPTTFSGREGEVMEGRFRLVRIGVESAVVEYADGRGQTTLPLNGQACVGK